jgi:preprotein translocase subunit SecG
MQILLYISMFIFLLVCVFLILLILIQKGRGGGLASAFGGQGGNTAFGSKTGDVLTWVTSIVFGLFLLLAVALNLLGDHVNKLKTGASVRAPVAASPAEQAAPPAGQVPVEAPIPAAPVTQPVGR